MAYQVELTDTFGGEANYSWVKRKVIQTNTKARQREVMKEAKAAVDLTNVKGRTTNLGDGYEFRPYGLLQVMFVTWIDSEETE